MTNPSEPQISPKAQTAAKQHVGSLEDHGLGLSPEQSRLLSSVLEDLTLSRLAFGADRRRLQPPDLPGLPGLVILLLLVAENPHEVPNRVLALFEAVVLARDVEGCADVLLRTGLRLPAVLSRT